MLQYEIAAAGRKVMGKGAMRKIRRDGMTPAVLYGANTESMALQIDSGALTKTLLTIQGRNALITLNINNDGQESKRHVMVKEIQTEPISDAVLHTDFVEISLEKIIALEVPLHYTGKAKGVEMGGELLITKRSVHMQGRILDIPDTVDVDVTNLGIGENIHSRDLSASANVTILDAPDAVCVSVLAPVVSAAETKPEETKKKK